MDKNIVYFLLSIKEARIDTFTIATEVKSWLGGKEGNNLEMKCNIKTINIKLIENISTWIGDRVNGVDDSNKICLSFLASLFSFGLKTLKSLDLADIRGCKQKKINC